MKEPLIIFYSRTQHSNLGDAIICHTLVTRLQRHGSVVILDWFADPHFSGLMTSSGARLLASEIRSISGCLRWGKNVVSALAERRLFLFLPPGHVFAQRDMAALFRHIKMQCVVALLRLARVPVVRLGVSIDLCAPHKWLVSAMLHNLDVIGLRDREGVRISRCLGVRRAGFFPDLYFVHQFPVSCARPSHIPYLVACFRPQCSGVHHDDSYANKLIELVVAASDDFIARTPGGAVIFCYQVQSDRDFARMLCERFGVGERSTLLGRCLSFREAVAVYGGATAVMTNRMHCALIASEVGTPVVFPSDLRSHTKASRLFDDSGLDVATVDLREGDMISEVRSAVARRSASSGRAGFRVKKREYSEIVDSTLSNLFQAEAGQVV